MQLLASSFGRCCLPVAVCPGALCCSSSPMQMAYPWVIAPTDGGASLGGSQAPGHLLLGNCQVATLFRTGLQSPIWSSDLSFRHLAPMKASQEVMSGVRGESRKESKWRHEDLNVLLLYRESDERLGCLLWCVHELQRMLGAVLHPRVRLFRNLFFSSVPDRVWRT